MLARSGFWKGSVVTGLLACLTILAASGIASATPPWKKLIPFKSVEADRNKTYWLTENEGPWLIFVTSFAGAGAEQQAHELVLELRSRYKMLAFMHKKHFGFDEPIYGRGLNRFGGPKRMKYQNTQSFDEIAVLVGNYASHDAPAAEQDLEKIKTSSPKCLGSSGRGDGASTQRFNVLRELQRAGQQGPAGQGSDAAGLRGP